eukprot:6047176-Prymnesium_polylepis.2
MAGRLSVFVGCGEDRDIGIVQAIGAGPSTPIFSLLIPDGCGPAARARTGLSELRGVPRAERAPRCAPCTECAAACLSADA